jgi:hypothetical protein
MRKMEVVIAPIQSTRNTDLGVLVCPIQSTPMLPALPTIHGGIPCHISLPPSKLDRSTGISKCADNDHWASLGFQKVTVQGTSRLTGPLRHGKKSHVWNGIHALCLSHIHILMASRFMLFTISCNASHKAGTGFRVS